MLLCVCAVLVLPFIANIFTMPIIGILKGCSAFDRKTERLIHKASTFDSDATLRRLQEFSINQPYYLFDQHLDAAEYNDGLLPDPVGETQASLGSFDFNGSDALTPAFYNAEHVIRDGICFITCSPGALIANERDLSFPIADFSEIEIRLKSERGKELLLGLSSNPDALWSERDKIVKEAKVGEWSAELHETCAIPLAIISDGNFHTYNINIESTLTRAWVAFDTHVRRFFISLPDDSGNRIEIDYIRFLTKKEKFQKIPFGTTHIQKNREYRKAVYVNTPGSLRYSVTIPQEAVWLSFGTGVLMPDDPVEFTVCLEIEGRKHVLLQETARHPERWSFHRLDLDEYAGTSVDIVFSASSKRGNVAFWSNPLLYTHPQKRFNVVVVLEDALRADHLSLYGYSARDTSPARKKFAEQGVVFEKAFSQATATRPSCPSFMTSLYPTAAGVGLPHEALHDNYLTLAEVMRSQGYATAAISQNQNAGFYNGLHQGFSRLYAVEKPTRGNTAAEVYGTQLNTWLDDIQGRNFFLYLHIMDPHGPYDAPAPFDDWYRQVGDSGSVLVRDPASDPAWVEKPTTKSRRLLYDGAIRHNDHWFERFIDMLSSRGLLESTLIVFMADHGEHLGERGVWGHAPPGYIQGINVPLFMVYPPVIPAGKRVTIPVQLLDVMPTILDLAGIDPDQLVLQGDSLLSLIDGSRADFWSSRICFSEEVINRARKMDARPFGSIVSGNWHLLNSKEFLPPQLREKNSSIAPLFFKAFDFRNDPSEDRPLKIFYADPFSKMLAAHVMEKFHRANQQLYQTFVVEKQETVSIDPVVQERLRALGYLQ